MIFSLDFTLPITATKAAPQHAVLVVTKGLVYRVEFQFPAGCAGLAHMAVFDGSFQVWPSTLGEFFHTDNFTIAFDEMYLKSAAPYQFDFYGYNLDETYPHTIYCRIGLADKDIFMARYLPSVAYELMQKELAKVAAEQEAKKAAVLASPFPWLGVAKATERMKKVTG